MITFLSSGLRSVSKFTSVVFPAPVGAAMIKRVPSETLFLATTIYSLRGVALSYWSVSPKIDRRGRSGVKKNSACNIWFLAGIFFLVSQQIFCDGQADTETTLNHHDSTPVSSFDTFAPDNALFPINVDRFGSRSQVVQTSEEKGGDVSLEGSALSELMDQIEKSLEEVESAVKVPVLLSAPAGPVEPIIPLPLTILTKSAEKGPEKPSAPSVPDKPKEKEPEKPPMPDDVDMTPRELDVLHAIDDQTLLTPEKGNNILFNASMPLTGSMALVGRDYLTGINLVFDKFNRSGGLEKKYLLKYSTIDDRYISTEAKINVLKSAKSSPFFVGNFGSHLLATVKNLIEKNEVLMLFPTAGDRAFRNKNYKYLLNLRPSMNAELKALIKYAINSQHRKKIAVFLFAIWGAEFSFFIQLTYSTSL